MSFTVTPTEDDVLTAVRTLLLTIVDGSTVEVVQGQVNRVPECKSPDFIVMTPTTRLRLSTDEDNWDTVGTNPAVIVASYNTEYTLQLDIHGPNGSDNAAAICTLWRNPYACDQMAGTGVTPLYATDGKQMPFINGESQWENRWVTTLSMQITPTVSTPMQFADTLDVTISSALGGV